ncbi:MAG: hypothetical protein LBU92_03960 [Prevotellaceae bacterium]|jgi:hypothetical protein|nr:hypothetical protein [Prevotellaceae bacterium]
MKKVLILLLGVAVIASSCGRADKKAAAKQAEIERIRMQQDSARRADEERMLELQMKARQDSLAMAMAMSSYESAEPAPASAFYVVVGSFKIKSNATSYMSDMQETFDDVQIVSNGGWSFVCVGGKFSSFGAAARTIDDVTSQLGGGGGDEEEYAEDEEYMDEEGGGEEEYAEEETYDEEGGDEEYMDEEEGYEDEEGGGEAWVMAI